MVGELILSDTIDDKERGPYTIIESTAIDGNIADVYGEFPETSAENAKAIVDGMNELAELRAENARLDQALADTAAQLTQAVERAQEAEAYAKELERELWGIAQDNAIPQAAKD